MAGTTIRGQDAWDIVKKKWAASQQKPLDEAEARQLTLARHHLNMKGSYFEDQIVQDVGMWYGALKSDSTGTLGRIFQTLYYGGLFVYRDNGYVPWAGFRTAIAVALSHGGRVIFQLPAQPKNANDVFWQWLTAGNSGIRSRGGGTHYLAVHDSVQAQLGQGRALYLSEEGGNKAAARSMAPDGGKHYGFNIALGGAGERNPWSGQVIQADGSHGHLYLYYRAPTEIRMGGIMIGCEGSQPPDWQGGGGFLGTLKAAVTRDFATDQTGGIHRFGESNTFTATGGIKFKDRTAWTPNPRVWHTCGPMKDLAGLVVDLAGGGGFTRIMGLKDFDAELVGLSGVPPKA